MASQSAAAIIPQVQIITLEEVAINLADEGVPVRAIARASKTPSEELRVLFKEAIETGKLIEFPKDDWPPGSRQARQTADTPLLNYNENQLRMACAKLFKTSRLQSAVLLAFLRRKEMTKDQIHNVIESMRKPGSEPTDAKMVDVVVCHIRKRLKPYRVIMETIWGIGYSLPTPQRDVVLTLLKPLVEGV